MSASTAQPVTVQSSRPPRLTITVDGRLDALTGPDLRARILEAGELGYEVCVDLSRVPEMDAAGLAAIISPRRRLRAIGLDVHLIGATSPDVARTLAVTRFAPLFDLGAPAQAPA